MPTESALQPPLPVIAGYVIERQFAASRAFLAHSDTGRRVVLKPLDADCLLQGRLHPSIHARLSRVRELAHPGVANLHGVVVDHHQPWLVWDYVEGTSIVALVETRNDATQLAALARELLVAVDALHAAGLVHGALVSGNVIIDPAGKVKLTHVSPLLHEDSRIDVRAVSDLLTVLAQKCRADPGWRLSEYEETSLKDMRRMLARSAEGSPETVAKSARSALRLRPVLVTLVVLACAAAAFFMSRRLAVTAIPADLNPARVER